MNKKPLSMTLLALLLAMLMLLTAGCGSKDTNTPDSSADQIAELEAKNAQLQAQIDKLTAQLGANAQEITLKDWTLDAKAWSDGNGATVTFTAIPAAYTDGMKAALSVRIGELEAESTNCNWDGSAFAGSVELSAADGYSYYCILTNPDGSQQEVELNSPDNVTNDALVHLGSNLSAYANLVVEEWEADDDTLTIKSGFAQCQMPRMTSDSKVSSISVSSLVLQLNGEEVSRQEITLEEGEGSMSFEAILSNQSFAMPDMDNDCQLDLWLEITLNNGSVITVSGGSWYGTDTGLQMVVG